MRKGGTGWHPSLKTHRRMADELTVRLREIMSWNLFVYHSAARPDSMPALFGGAMKNAAAFFPDVIIS